MTEGIPRLSLILPCYNGGSYIQEALATLFAWLREHEAALGPYEVLLVDDGSPDDTSARARAAGLPLQLITLERNSGKGAAVRRGMLAARGRFRIFMDSDLPFELPVLERILHYLEFKEFDIVVGSRAPSGASYSVARPASRTLASRIFTEFVGRLVVTGVRDTQCGIKGFRGDVAAYLFGQSRVERFAFDVEILYLAFKNNFDVKTLPVKVLEERPSTLSVWRHSLPMLIEVLKLPWRWHRGQYQLYSGRTNG